MYDPWLTWTHVDKVYGGRLPLLVVRTTSTFVSTLSLPCIETLDCRLPYTFNVDFVRLDFKSCGNYLTFHKEIIKLLFPFVERVRVYPPFGGETSGP